MRPLFAASLFSLLTLFAAAGHAQQPAANDPPPDPGEYKLTIQTRIVNVTAIVHDNDGGVVRDLQKDDFILKVDGKPQPLRYFDVDNDLPLTLGLLVDTSGSQTIYAEQERAASHTFLKQMLTRPQDRAFLERFDYKASILHKLTSDTAALDRALALLIDPPGTQARGGTLLWDATVATLFQIVSKEPGRRALIIMTDGEDAGSKLTLQDAITAALMNDVAIYSILYTEKNIGYLGPMNPQLRQAMPKTFVGPYSMEVLSQTTGGRAFAVSPTMPIEKIFAAIEEDLRSEYRFSFTPVAAPVNTFHKIEVKTKHGHYDIHARSGYYAK
jgi:Ca-activated chloride channel family protein